MNLFGLTEKLSSLIIRPPRVTYSRSQLGPQCFECKNSTYRRIDFQVKNYRGFQLECSLYKLINSSHARPVIILLHANSSSRLAAKSHLYDLLPTFDVVSFDFAGSGISGGKYTTLGYEEKEDLHTVIKYLHSKYKVNHIVLWGRSMGAVTAILYTSKYQKTHHIQNNPQKTIEITQNNCNQLPVLVRALILDSPFCSLPVLIKQLGSNYFPYLPNFILDSFSNQIQSYIEENVWSVDKTDFDINKLNPLNVISNIRIPIFYLTTKNDQLVNSKHTLNLYQATKTLKQLQIVEGGHNDRRPIHANTSILEFIFSVLKIQHQNNNTPKINPNTLKQINQHDQIGFRKMVWKKKHQKKVLLIDQLSKNSLQNPYTPSQLSQVKVQNNSQCFKKLNKIETKRKSTHLQTSVESQSNCCNSSVRSQTKTLNHSIKGSTHFPKIPKFLIKKTNQKNQALQSNFKHLDNQNGLNLVILNDKKMQRNNNDSIINFKSKQKQQLTYKPNKTHCRNQKSFLQFSSQQRRKSQFQIIAKQLKSNSSLVNLSSIFNNNISEIQKNQPKQGQPYYQIPQILKRHSQKVYYENTTQSINNTSQMSPVNSNTNFNSSKYLEVKMDFQTILQMKVQINYFLEGLVRKLLKNESDDNYNKIIFILAQQYLINLL